MAVASTRLPMRFKRLSDVSVSLVLLVILSPVFALVAGLIRIWMRPPILFRQWRPGLGGDLFQLVKLRTMGPEDASVATRAFDRVTPFGRFLRIYGIDELPELVNVLSSRMSLVGPRPLLVEYLDRYTAEQARRHEMKPGVTGLAQVEGRQGLIYSRKLELDVWYVDNWSLWLDLKILVRTGALVGPASCAPRGGCPLGRWWGWPI